MDAGFAHIPLLTIHKYMHERYFIHTGFGTKPTEFREEKSIDFGRLCTLRVRTDGGSIHQLPLVI